MQVRRQAGGLDATADSTRPATKLAPVLILLLLRQEWLPLPRGSASPSVLAEVSRARFPLEVERAASRIGRERDYPALTANKSRT